MFGVRKGLHRATAAALDDTSTTVPTTTTTTGTTTGTTHTTTPTNCPGLQVLSFVASTSKSLAPGGDPFAPATKIVGRFQQLRAVSRQLPCLCEYIDISKSPDGRMYIVSEGVIGSQSLQALLSSSPSKTIRSLDKIKSWARELVHALMHLHEHGIVHRNLHPKHIYIDRAGHIKLVNYGLYFLTGSGQDVAFPIGYPHYLSPETISNGPFTPLVSSPKVDVWGLGILLLELYFGSKFLQTDIKNVRMVLNSILKWNTNVICMLDSEDNMDSDMKAFIKECLNFIPSNRPTLSALANHSFIDTQSQHNLPDSVIIPPHAYNRQRFYTNVAWAPKPFILESQLKPVLKNTAMAAAVAHSMSEATGKESTSNASQSFTTLSRKHTLTSLNTSPESSVPQPRNENQRYQISLSELYYYWKMTGGDLESLVLKHQRTTNIPSLFKLPTLVRIGGNPEEILQTALAHLGANLFSDMLMDIPTHFVCTKIDSFERDSHTIDGLNSGRRYSGVSDIYRDEWKHPTRFKAADMDAIWESYLAGQRNAEGVGGSFQLALSTRESDMRYQYHRTKLFYRLLCSYPSSVDSIRYEAISDVPPLLRGRIWAALLDVTGDTDLLYDSFDKDTEVDTDRQLDLDIPRCHQYNELLSSPVGHAKLKRVLKAWVASEKGQHVYWQGLDSMCAPFLVLNFDDEGLAFASMSAFITKYCRRFFVIDNSKLMREFMLAFRYILSFHDPELSVHLYTIGLGPELFAISWFMTLFAHVFPLDKIYHLWDYFLVTPPFMFIYIGVSILQQNRDQLLRSDFSQAMMLFSEMPDVDVEKCIIYSIQAVKITPPSLLNHLYSPPIAASPSPTMNSSNKRFSFFNNKRGIVGSLGIDDFIEIRKHSIVLDIRQLDVFQQGHVSGSIQVNTEQIRTISFGLKIVMARSRYIVVLASDEETGGEFAMMLVTEKQPHVLLLTVSDPDLLAQAYGGLCNCTPNPFGSGNSASSTTGTGLGIHRCAQ
ncbi:hypothetical protein BASA61_005900 [Batrachochytrium salamandrivorans]|nr:hypothetical protein BASA61_005900 [Batrachochytrium salamandrivorans]